MTLNSRSKPVPIEGSTWRVAASANAREMPRHRSVAPWPARARIGHARPAAAPGSARTAHAPHQAAVIAGV